MKFTRISAALLLILPWGLVLSNTNASLSCDHQLSVRKGNYTSSAPNLYCFSLLSEDTSSQENFHFE
ncbi:MAG: hypothetical protein KDC53_23410, partial [Saprospiraceae bacterium]|nr:hypothetical protein [Saprospiraceae bacterium]